MSSFFIPAIELIAGLALLIVSAECLTSSSIRLASHFGIKPVVIGLTIIALGTSAPELFVSLVAAVEGQPDISVGNIVGSNIANIGLILGLGALTAPFSIPRRIARIEMPFLTISILGLGAASFMGRISRTAALAFLALFAGYLFILWKYKAGLMADRPQGARATGAIKEPRCMYIFVVTALSLAGLLAGSKLLVTGCVEIAYLLDCPKLIIALTLTAVGTSLPELASTISAARRSQGGLIIGNVLGSNFINTCAVLGLTGMIKPLSISRHVLTRDFPVMAVLSLALFPIMTRRKIKRQDGACLLVAYFAYIVLLYFI